MTMRTAIQSIGRVLMMSTLLLGNTQSADAAALFTLKGQTLEAKAVSDSEIRLSVIGWSQADKASALVAEYQKYVGNQNHAEFAKFLQAQETLGFLFTKEATGYSVKYAWQSDGVTGKKMVLLVVPALKSKNPYMWKQRNEQAAPFTLLELSTDGNEQLLHTSLDAAVTVNLQGQLELDDNAQTPVFARLRDDTPYYLRN